MPHFMIVLLPYINLLNLSLIKKKMAIFEEYGAFNLRHNFSEKELCLFKIKCLMRIEAI